MDVWKMGLAPSRYRETQEAGLIARCLPIFHGLGVTSKWTVRRCGFC
jgi:hypothetical protein